ncbi:MAG TPA: HPP family protein [Acidimicrobiales bacterium]|nr:HPP family protein [Acidimicrobiales bacterium]
MTAGDGDGRRRPGPIGGDMAAIVLGLARRVRLTSLTERYDSTLVLGLFAFVNGLIAIGAMASVAYVTGEPFVFPSLGPTAFLLFYTPLQPAASPRNTLGGHAIGAAAGYLALVVFGLTDDAPALASGVTGSRVGAAALSLGLTSGAMVWARVPHPPAGATTLIVSLGILREPEQFAVLMVAVALLVVQGLAINRLAGIPYPLWRAAAPPTATAGGRGGT